MRLIILAAAVALLSACGDAGLQQAKDQVAAVAKDAAQAAAGAVDTRTACMLAGQSEAFCGCVQERLGPDIKGEHLEAVTAVVRRTIAGEPIEKAAEGAAGVDATTRTALVQCATTAAIDGAVNEGAN